MNIKPQLILVADDETLLELAKGSKIKFDKELFIEFALLIGAVITRSPVGVMLTHAASLAFKNLKIKKQKKPNNSLLILREHVLKQIQKELNLSSEIYCISPLEALDMKLDIGDKPTNGSFYIKHPLLDDVYIRPHEYESKLAREKEAAFRRLSSSLGAQRIILKDAKFFDKKGKVTVDSRLLSSVCSKLGISAQFDKTGGVIKEVFSEFGKPRKQPYIPEELKEWTRLDPDLRTMAHDRLEGHLLKHQVTLQFREAVTGGGKIAAEIANKGLDINSSNSKNISSVWVFEVEYYPL